MPTRSPDRDGWEVGEVEPPRGLLVPLLIGVSVLLLASVVGLGVWLALRARETGPGPEPTLTSTTRRTPAPTTTAPPSTPPASPTAATVTLPDERGQDPATATSDLETLGLVVVTSEMTDPEVPAGQVITTSPSAGSAVAPGSTVTIVVSLGAPSASPTVPPTSPAPTSPAPTA